MLATYRSLDTRYGELYTILYFSVLTEHRHNFWSSSLLIYNTCKPLYPSIIVNKSIYYSLSAILINRLILNLRTHLDASEQRTDSSLPEIVFASDSVIGNIGAPLRDFGESYDMETINKQQQWKRFEKQPEDIQLRRRSLRSTESEGRGEINSSQESSGDSDPSSVHIIIAEAV